MTFDSGTSWVECISSNSDSEDNLVVVNNTFLEFRVEQSARPRSFSDSLLLTIDRAACDRKVICEPICASTASVCSTLRSGLDTPSLESGESSLSSCESVVSLSDCDSDEDGRCISPVAQWGDENVDGDSASVPVTTMQGGYINCNNTRPTFIGEHVYAPCFMPVYGSSHGTMDVSSSSAPVQTFIEAAVQQTEDRTGNRRRRRTTRMMRKALDTCDEPEELTTLLLRNLPNNLTRSDLLKLFDDADFKCQYDFVYLPIDFDSDANLGYAFVNVADGDAGLRFRDHFQGFAAWGDDRASNKVLKLEWSQLQGLQKHVERYRNSPLLHDDMCDSRQPTLFVNGDRVAFPSPTCSVKAPRRRGRYAVARNAVKGC